MGIVRCNMFYICITTIGVGDRHDDDDDVVDDEEEENNIKI